VVRADSADVKKAAHDSHTRTALFVTRRQTKDGPRICAQLSSSDDEILFEEAFDLNNNPDPAGFAQRFAAQIFSILNAKDWSGLIAAKRDPGLQNPQARELIAAGRELHFRYSVLDLDRGIGCFEKAIGLEPRSALAHAYLSMSAASRIHLVSDARFLDRAEREANEAFRLAPSLVESHRALAGVLYQRGQLRAALEEQKRAIELSGPEEHNAGFIGMTLQALGEPDRALPWYEMARGLASHPGAWDPLIGDCWSKMSADDEAETAYRRATILESELPRGWIGIARLRLLQGKFEEARNICRDHLSQQRNSIYLDETTAMIEFFARNFPEAERLYGQLEKKDPDGGGRFYGGISYKSALGRLIFEKDARHGKRLLEESLASEHKQLVIAPANPEVLYRVAATESSLGQAESAITHLQAAVAGGWIDYRSLSRDPRFDTIANDIRFQTLLGKLKLRMDDLRKATQTTEPQHKQPQESNS
jgi:tetratricopeptide (TPR) repeat protein